MSHSLTEIRPVSGRRDFRRFIDYAYERNAGDPRWVPPLRLAERERLTPRKNPFFAHADIESSGYQKVKDLFAWLYDLERDPLPLLVRLAERARDRHGIIVRSLNLAEFTREVERLRVIYVRAWEHNWGFVAPTADEFRRL